MLPKSFILKFMFGLFFQSTVSGLPGAHGDLVLSRVAVVANHDQERAPILHQPTEVKTVLEQTLKQPLVTRMDAQVTVKNKTGTHF